MSASKTPIYLISMEKDEERRRNLASLFPRYYPIMKYLPAIDGRQLSTQEYFSHIAKPLARGRRLMLPGEVGCSLSHINALECFLQSNHSFALILEDDVIGTDESIDNLLGIVPSLPESSLAICGGQEGMPARKYILGKPTNTADLFKVAPFSYDQIFRTCSYVVTRQSAKTILEAHSESMELADAWGRFFRGKDFDIYYTPKFAHPKELKGSHMEKERALFGHNAELDKRKLSARVKRRLSRIKRKVNAVFYFLMGYRRIVR